MNLAPQYLQDRPMFSAFTLGATGAYAVAKVGQELATRVVPRVIPDFYDRWLPIIEKIYLGGVPSLALLYILIDPDGAAEIITQHPVYTSGMAGVYFGGMAGAIHDLGVRSRVRQRS